MEPPRPWRELLAAERQGILEAVQGSLESEGLEALVAVSREVELLWTLDNAEQAEAPRLLLLGFCSKSQEQKLEALRKGPLAVVADVLEAVTVADAKTPPGQAVRDACRECWSRCAGQSAALDEKAAESCRALASAAAWGGAGLQLSFLRCKESWASCAGLAERQSVHLEGYAPASLQGQLGDLAAGVQWYESGWQAAVLAARHGKGPRLPESPLRLVAPPKSLLPWLQVQERLLAPLEVAPVDVPEHAAWQSGAQVLTSSPTFIVFPNFLAEEERRHFLRLALTFQQPAEGEPAATAVPLPSDFKDRTLEALQARLGAALELQDEGPPAALVWEEKGAGSMVRRNGSGQGGLVKARAVVWLTASAGGVLRFPWTGLPAAPADASAQALLRAGEQPGGHIVRPKPGTAVVLRTLTEDGEEDRRAWHLQRAWRDSGAWTLQKLWLAQPT